MQVLVCCSDLSYKGGMVSVVKGYLDYRGWDEDVALRFVPTHCDAGKAGLVACFAKALVRIVGMARRGEIDVAHLHVSERGSFVRKGLLLKILKRYGVPVVLHHHGAEFELWYSGLPGWARRWVDGVLSAADLNIVLSRRLIPMIAGKAASARVEALYNAVAVGPDNPYGAGARGVLLLGRLGERKGVYDLLEAMAMIDGSLPRDVKFYLCGDGEVDEVRERVERLGLGHRVAHVGWISGEEKERILVGTMINVLPSYNEGLPMTILETMARGIPNVSTPIASIPEVITDGVTGLLVAPGDVAALAAAIERLASDAGLRSAISEASHELIVSRFSLPGAIARLTEIYRALIK